MINTIYCLKSNRISIIKLRTERNVCVLLACIRSRRHDTKQDWWTTKLRLHRLCCYNWSIERKSWNFAELLSPFDFDVTCYLPSSRLICNQIKIIRELNSINVIDVSYKWPSSWRREEKSCNYEEFPLRSITGQITRSPFDETTLHGRKEINYWN